MGETTNKFSKDLNSHTVTSYKTLTLKLSDWTPVHYLTQTSN